MKNTYDLLRQRNYQQIFEKGLFSFDYYMIYNYLFQLECVKGLNFVIFEARKHGIKLMLSLMNNYDSFGGRKQYVNPARNKGHYLTSDIII